jgi:hypothetical protein
MELLAQRWRIVVAFRRMVLPDDQLSSSTGSIAKRPTACELGAEFPAALCSFFL